MPHTLRDHRRQEGQYQGAARVKQTNWGQPNLLKWSDQITRVVNKSTPGSRWVAVAHSFGSLTLAHHLSMRSSQTRQASSAICSALSAWAEHWGAHFHHLGQAGHINAASAHGPWPWVRFKVDQLVRDQQRERRLERAHPMELS